MAQTVINSYADELENYIEDFERMEPTLSRCKLITIPFIVTFTSQVVGEDVALAVIPKGARLIEGVLAASASMGSTEISIGLAGKDGSGTIDAAGTSDNVAFLKAAATQSTTKVVFAATVALGYLYKAEKELWLTLTTSAATVGTQVLSGHVTFAYPS